MTVPRAAVAVLPLAVAILGLLAGAALGALFDWLHSSWYHLDWVTPEAANTVPYWVPQGLAPILTSAIWTALILRARSVGGWALLGAGVASLQIVLFAIGLVPIALAGNRGVPASGLAWPALTAVALGSPFVAGVWPPGKSPGQVGAHVTAAIAFPVCLIIGYSLVAGPFPH